MKSDRCVFADNSNADRRRLAEEEIRKAVQVGAQSIWLTVDTVVVGNAKFTMILYTDDVTASEAYTHKTPRPRAQSRQSYLRRPSLAGRPMSSNRSLPHELDS